jgi:hypothetical protein
MRGVARVAPAVRFQSRRLRARLRRLALELDPTPARVRRRISVRPAVGVVCCVYRVDHADHALALVDDAQRAGLTPRLWALERSVPSLDRWTVGEGSGFRQSLLNRLVSEATDGWVVLADDDVVLHDGSLALLLTIAARVGLDVVQPGHAASSRASTEFVRAQPRVGARRTGFVEIGPLVALDAGARDALLPLDESLGMGWGQDYLWARALEGAGITAGIVDAVRMRHLSPFARTYDHGEATAHLEDCLARTGYASVSEPMVTYTTWRARDLEARP